MARLNVTNRRAVLAVATLAYLALVTRSAGADPASATPHTLDGWWLTAAVLLVLVLAGIRLQRLRMSSLLHRERELENRVKERTQALKQEIAERELAEAALVESEERYALAIRGTNDGIWDYDLRSETIYFSPRFKAILGYEDHELASDPSEWWSRVHPADLERVRSAFAGLRQTDQGAIEEECRTRHRDGSFRWVLLRGYVVRSATGERQRLVGALTDVTFRHSYDPLTALHNRAYFADRVEYALTQAREQGEHRFAVLFLDLERFKMVNDSFGHRVGDELLVAVARRLSAVVRSCDLICRLGGDEFAVLVTGVAEPPEVLPLIERIQRALESALRIDDQELFVSASVGVAFSTPHCEHADDLLRDAETAMYRGKAAGHNVEFFDVGMRQHVQRTLSLQNDLRRAIERDEFRLRYQAIFALESGRVDGVEALLRWQHPERGILYPGEFIPLAEEIGLIVPISRWVLRNACRQMRSWLVPGSAHPQLTMSVNISCKHFADAALLDDLRAILEETGVAPHRLRLEITETTLMGSDGAVHSVLAGLRELRVALDIDDFGTGYSSLSYLRRLPIDALKIDRSFIAELGAGAESAAIVHTIVSLARNMGLSVIAEGVETAEQLALLRSLGCERAQGHFFHAAADPETIGALLSKGSETAN